MAEEKSYGLEKIQQAEIEILHVFVDYCEKHNLRYYLGGGTLLGAIRHGKVIPWDDDVDVLMPRPDYVKFLASAQSELPENIFLQTYVTDPEYPFPIAKLRNSNTTFVEDNLAHLHINHGIYIDIFALDGVPSVEEHKKRRQKLLYYAYAVNARNGKSTAGSSLWGKTTNFGLKILTAFTTPQKILAASDKVRCQNPFDESPYAYASYDPMCDKTEWFGRGKVIEFYGFPCRIPDNTEAYLHSHYGDYMQLPPEEKRMPPHHVKYCDFEKPYTEYVK